MKTKTVSVNKLNAAAYNPRKDLQPDDPEYMRIKRSIEKYGYVDPIVWNEKTGNVVGGHQRLKVLKDLGNEEIEVSVVNLNSKDEKLLNLALNKIKTDWDWEKLEGILKDFTQEEAEDAGMTAAELALLLSEEDEEDWSMDWEDEGEEVGESYVITLKFDSSEEAKEWADSEGLENSIHAGTTTSVIRMEDNV